MPYPIVDYLNDNIILDDDKKRHIYVIGFNRSSDQKKFFCVGRQTIRTNNELLEFINNLNFICDDIKNNYPPLILEIFQKLIRSYIDEANIYTLPGLYDALNYYSKRFTVSDIKSHDILSIEHSIDLFTIALYDYHQYRLNIDGLNFTRVEGEEFGVLPILSDKGVILNFNNMELEASFNLIPLATLEEILNRIKNTPYDNNIKKQQIIAEAERLIKESKDVGLKIAYHSEDIKESLDKLAYEYCYFLGADISKIN